MIVEFAFFVGSVRYVRHLRYNRRNTIEYGNVYNHYEQRIRVEEDTYAALAALKGDDETFDDLLTRLVDERCEQIRAGAGLWQGTHAAEKARDVRSQLKRDVGSR